MVSRFVTTTSSLLLIAAAAGRYRAFAFLAATPQQRAPSSSSSGGRYQYHRAAFGPPTTGASRPLHQPRTRFNKRLLSAKRRDDQDNIEEEEDDDDEIDISSLDWRAFRAKLVMGEPRLADDDNDGEGETFGNRDFPAPPQFGKSFVSMSIEGSGIDGNSNNVKNDRSSSSSSKNSNNPDDVWCDPETGLCDYDGIGNFFDADTADVKKSQQASARQQSRLEKMTPLDPTQWAYESGHVIEKGAVILGGVDQEYGFGLRQQYFHKAAILVLDHDETTFTKGIILNRPTDLYLEDDINPGVKWRLWYGGDVQGLNTPNPDIVCLHSIKSKAVTDASVPVMNDIQWTTFDNAKKLVQSGQASPDDFWVFCGYAGWGPSQLMEELDRDSWYMVATDSQTLLQELSRHSTTDSDPRDAGLETWLLLMNMIGRGETADDCVCEFDDLMLKEFARKHLLSTRNGGEAGEQGRRLPTPEEADLAMKSDEVDNLLHSSGVFGSGPSAAGAPGASSRFQLMAPGTLLRASPSDRSPFLLDEQEFHKSIVLVLSDDEHMSVGAMLNRPATKALDVQVMKQDGSGPHTHSLPIRFGGQYSVKGSDPLLWMHMDPRLRAAGVGRPIGDPDGIWECTADDVTAAVGQGLATPQDFLVVTGVTCWSKEEGGAGIQGELNKGKFEVVQDFHVPSVWNALLQQEVLTTHNLLHTLAVADDAWVAGGAPQPFHQQQLQQPYQHSRPFQPHPFQPHPHQPSQPYEPSEPYQPQSFQPRMSTAQTHGYRPPMGITTISAHGETSYGDPGPNPSHYYGGPSPNYCDYGSVSPVPNYSGYDMPSHAAMASDSKVFKSDIDVARLCDKALQSWVATFLLGSPTLGA